MTANYQYLVIEHYPDGGRWRHYVSDKETLEATLEGLSEAHPSRRLEVIELES